MSRLAVRAEIIKLGQVLERVPLELDFLQAIPLKDLHGLRLALDEVLFEQHRQLLRRMAVILRWLPSGLIAFLARRVLGARLFARVVAVLPARVVARVTPRLPDAFIADGVRYMDPRRLLDAIAQTPLETSQAVLSILLERRDYVSLGRLVEYLPDETIRAMERQIADDAAVVEIAFYMESKSRLEHFVGLLPRERLYQSMRLLQDPSRRALWTKVMVLLMYVSPGLQRELTDLMVAQGEAVLSALTAAIHEEGLFADLLPARAAFSQQTLQLVTNLKIMREPGVMEALLRAVDEGNHWGAELATLRWMDEDLLDRVAMLLGQMPQAALERVVYAAVCTELWDPLLDLVRRMPTPRQRDFAGIVLHYGAVDGGLLRRVAQRALAYGLGHLFAAAQAERSPPPN